MPFTGKGCHQAASWSLLRKDMYIFAPLSVTMSFDDRAKPSAGFHHSDLRLANVMEILPTEDGSKEKAEEQTNPDEHHLEENEPREGRPVIIGLDFRTRVKGVERFRQASFRGEQSHGGVGIAVCPEVL